MPLILLLLGAGGAYWWWKQHQQAPSAPTATAGTWPGTITPSLYGLTPNSATEVWDDQQTSGVQLVRMPPPPPPSLAAYALPLPGGGHDNGLAAQAVVAASAAPATTQIDWFSLLNTAASVATIATMVGSYGGGYGSGGNGGYSRAYSGGGHSLYAEPSSSEWDMIRWGLSSAGSEHVGDLIAKFGHYPRAREMLSRRYSNLRSQGF